MHSRHAHLQLAQRIRQGISARNDARLGFAAVHDVNALLFAPKAIAGYGVSQLVIVPAWLSAAVASLLCMLLRNASNQSQSLQPVPPGEPPQPRLTHVCLASRLLPVPRAAWR